MKKCAYNCNANSFEEIQTKLYFKILLGDRLQVPNFSYFERVRSDPVVYIYQIMANLNIRESLHDTALRNLLIEVAKAGATQALVDSGSLAPFISKADSYRLYGRKSVDKWIKLGVLTVRGEGNEKQRIDRVEIQAIASSSSLANYINSRHFRDQRRKINIDESCEKLKANK